MTAWELPTTLTVHGKTYAIRTDYRVVLDILLAMNDPDLFEPDATEEEKRYIKTSVMLDILFEDFESLPFEDWQEASERACEFIDCGIPTDERWQPRTMDWGQDAGIIIPAVNKALGMEVRAVDYMHWWTFFGGYMEIGDSVFSQVLNIRQKKAKHKKLEKWEQEWYSSNKHLVDFHEKISEQQQREIDNINKWLG